jgi:hypothetical protein
MKPKRTRVKTGMLMFSTNPLKSIMCKRLQVLVRYTTAGMFSNIVKQIIIGIKV